MSGTAGPDFPIAESSDYEILRGFAGNDTLVGNDGLAGSVKNILARQNCDAQ
jgi:hypothetical protein